MTKEKNCRDTHMKRPRKTCTHQQVEHADKNQGARSPKAGQPPTLPAGGGCHRASTSPRAPAAPGPISTQRSWKGTIDAEWPTETTVVPRAIKAR